MTQTLENHIAALIAHCQFPDGEDAQGIPPSTVLQDLLADLPPNSSWAELGPTSMPPADVMLDVVVVAGDGVFNPPGRYVHRSVMASYPRTPPAPVFYDVASGRAVEIHGCLVTHYAVALMTLPPPVATTEP